MSWPLLGTPLDRRTTEAVKAMRRAGLTDWGVRLTSMQLCEPRFVTVVPDRRAVVRDNPEDRWKTDVLGIVSPTFRVTPNEGYAPLLDALVAESGATFAAAGELDGGRRAFVTLRLPGHTLVAGEQVHHLVTSVNCHDGSSAHSIIYTPVLARSGVVLDVWTLKPESPHPRRAAEITDWVFSRVDAFQLVTAPALTQRPCSKAQFEHVAWALLGHGERAAANTQSRATRKATEAVALFGDGTTHWDAYVALATWWDTMSPTRGKDRERARAMNAVFAPKFKRKARALLADS